MILIKDREDFRPRDWAIRLALDYGQPTWGFKPHITASTEGLLVEERLESSDPATFKWVMNFAKQNDLEVVRDDRT